LQRAGSTKRGSLMRKIFLVLLVFGVAVAATSCRTFQVSGMETSLVAAPGDVLGNFNTTVWVNKFLGTSGGANILNITSTAGDAAVANAIRQEIANMGGTRAINVTIEQRASFINLLLNSITGSIWAPSTVRITGTVVRDRAPGVSETNVFEPLAIMATE